MRVVKSFDDVNIVIKPIQDFISLFRTKDNDRRGLRLKNNGDAVDPQDYVTLKQLNTSTSNIPSTDQYYTIVFDFGGVPNGGNSFPGWVTGLHRTGIPIQVWAKCRTGPTSGAFTFNILLGGNTILAANLSIPMSDVAVHFASNFINPVPLFGLYSIVVPTLVTVNNASDITIGVVVKRDGG